MSGAMRQRHRTTIENSPPRWPEGADTARVRTDFHSAGVYLRRDPAPGAAKRAPVVVDSPHSGRHYPSDFGHTLPMTTMRRAEDAWVDELIWDAPAFGASFLAAEFPRAYVDPNRHEHDLDGALMDEPLPAHANPTYRSDWGLGVVRRLLGPREPIYDRPLSAAEIDRRIDAYHRPYHDALGAILDDAHRDFACVYHLNCHSMLSKGRGIARPDFVLSDADGETCDAEFRDVVRERLVSAGFGVSINDPFKGGEIVRRYGRPHEHRHSLQIEIRRGLYMDEKSVEKSADFDAIKSVLSDLIGSVSAYARDRSGR